MTSQYIAALAHAGKRSLAAPGALQRHWMPKRKPLRMPEIAVQNAQQGGKEHVKKKGDCGRLKSQ
jgi:hypothetical protein